MAGEGSCWRTRPSSPTIVCPVRLSQLHDGVFARLLRQQRDQAWDEVRVQAELEFKLAILIDHLSRKVVRSELRGLQPHVRTVQRAAEARRRSPKDLADLCDMITRDLEDQTRGEVESRGYVAKPAALHSSCHGWDRKSRDG